MREAAKIAISAIGMQDTHILSKDPKDSLFDSSYKQNSESRKYHRTRVVDNMQQKEWWPFGHTVKVDFSPKNMGDLLTNIWLKIELPEWTTSEMYDWDYGRFVGRRLIKNIKMIADGLILDEIDTEMMVIVDNLYKSVDQKLSLNSQLNLNRYDNSRHPFELDLDARKNLFIDLPFFFSQNYGGDAYEENKQNKPPFPLCAIHKQKIQFEIEFHKPTYFIYTNLSTNRFLPSKIINNFKIITEEVTISDVERLFYKTKPLKMTTEYMKKHSSRDIDVNTDQQFSVNLEPTIPVKMFHWFFRPKYFETDGNYNRLLVDHRMFFKTADFYIHRNQINIMGSAYFTLNGERFPRMTKIDAEYFKRVIPYTSKLSESGLSPTLQGTNNVGGEGQDQLTRSMMLTLGQNDIFSYNFALYPKSTQPSGFLDFSQLNSDKTQLHIELNPATLNNRIIYVDLEYTSAYTPLYTHVGSAPNYIAEIFTMDNLTMYLYYTGFNILQFEDGYVSFIN